MKVRSKLSLMIFLIHDSPLPDDLSGSFEGKLPTSNERCQWSEATSSQLWMKNFVPIWHKVRIVGNRKTKITSTSFVSKLKLFSFCLWTKIYNFEAATLIKHYCFCIFLIDIQTQSIYCLHNRMNQFGSDTFGLFCLFRNKS